MECRYCKDEFCVNDQSPMCADYCPVPDTPGVCQHEDRAEEAFELTPKGCAVAALDSVGVQLSNDLLDDFWAEFEGLMDKFGYIQREESEGDE